MEPEKIARVCHEANAAYCRSLGDNSQPKWEDAPLNIKASALDGVMFHLKNPEAGPSGSHTNWMKFKVEDGWVYGEEKDVEKKTHPCLVAFHELPEWQQSKDFIFHALTHTLRMM